MSLRNEVGGEKGIKRARALFYFSYNDDVLYVRVAYESQPLYICTWNVIKACVYGRSLIYYFMIRLPSRYNEVIRQFIVNSIIVFKFRAHVGKSFSSFNNLPSGKTINFILLHLLIYLAFIFESTESDSPLTAAIQIFNLAQWPKGKLAQARLLVVSPFFSILQHSFSGNCRCTMHSPGMFVSWQTLATRPLRWTPTLSHHGKRHSFLSNAGGGYIYARAHAYAE